MWVAGLSRLEVTLSHLQQERVSLAASVSDQLHAWSGDGDRTTSLLATCEHDLAELFGRIKNIKAQAHASERLVHSICRDIKTLDTGKRNLVRTVTTVKRLHMLMAGADQLGDMISHHQYQPAARLLQALTALLADIGQQLHDASAAPRSRSASTWPPVVLQLQHDVQQMKEQLFLSIFDEFKRYLHDSSADGQSGPMGHAAALAAPHDDQIRQLHDACLVLDVMGGGSKFTVLHWFLERCATICSVRRDVPGLGSECRGVDDGLSCMCQVSRAISRGVCSACA